LVRPNPEAGEISFNNQITSLGRYRYDFDFESGEHVESIYLPTGCEPKAEIWINFASGFGRMHGSLALNANGTRRSVDFSFLAEHGGDHSYHRDFWRKQSDHWLRINPFDLLTQDFQPHNPSATSKSRTYEK
jgi:hypothetical protein